MRLEVAILLTIFAFLAIALGLVLFVVHYQARVARHHATLQQLEAQQKEQLRQGAIEAEEAERRRIAGELHDDVCATLASAGMLLSGLPTIDSTQPRLQMTQAILQEALRKVRLLSHQLQPAALDLLSLEKAIVSLANTFSEASGLPITTSGYGMLPEKSPSEQMAVYRMVQELLHNTLKHAQPRNLQVVFDGLAHPAKIRIRHDGRGMTQAQFDEQLQLTKGIGLKNLVHRTSLSHTQLHWMTSPDGFYEVQICFPENEE